MDPEGRGVPSGKRNTGRATHRDVVGAFVTVAQRGDDGIPAITQARLGPDGIGRLVGVAEGVDRQAVVEYFVSPAGPTIERRIFDIGRLRRVVLWPETSVFWFDEGTDSWRRGRITASEREGVPPNQEIYRVKFPNGHEGSIPGPKLYVRWARPIGDPLGYLAARVTDTPYFFEGRKRIVAWIAGQRAAFGGLTGLGSASVDLLEHQAAIIRRILADPIQRYVLADEVGLGKTVEACIVINQHLIDDPIDASVVVVVPDHLVRQWKGELLLRFGIPESDRRVRVVPESSLSSGPIDGAAPTMLVVDEAHRSAGGAFSGRETAVAALFSNLTVLAATAPRVLLLSGTPVLRQEDGFLAMLHLLDPKAYPLEDREGFRERIRNRSAVADAVAQLTDDAGAMFVNDAVAQLERAFGADRDLRKFTREVAVHAEDDTSNLERMEAIRALRVHVTETYKLHRRLLRTRRDDPSLKGLLGVRKGLEKLPCDDPARRVAWELVEAWRTLLPLDGDGRPPPGTAAVFADLVEAALSHPTVLANHIRVRYEALTGTGHGTTAVLPAFADERGWCCRALEEIRAAVPSEPRAAALADWLARGKTKAIVFVDMPDVADMVAARLRSHLGSESVLRVGAPDGGERSGPDAIERFVHDARVHVLVGDRRAEEGLNLQGARGAVLVHYDLPYSPTRIEQRNGRVDRLDAKAVPRFLTFEGASTYEEAWLALLESRVQVFHRTVAPLQYILSESCQRMRDRLVSEGAHTFAEESARLSGRGGIEDELKLIRNQEALDSLGGGSDEDATLYERMRQGDEAASDSDGEDLEYWLCKRLRFLRSGIRNGEKAADFHYTYEVGGSVLLPLHEVVTSLGFSIDRENSKGRVLRFGRFTYDREEAVGENGVRLLRPGNQFLDAIEELVRRDDRGAAFAMWRHDASMLPDEAYLFFRFDFIVEADVEPARAVVRESNGAVEALRHLADAAFPPMSQTVWVDADCNPVTSSGWLEKLELEYDKRRDTNLRLDRWSRADAICPVHDWKGLCEKVREAAFAALWDETTRTARTRAVQKLEEKATAHRVQWQSRVARMPPGPARVADDRTAKYTAALDERLLRGIREPCVRVDSVGAVYLSGMMLSDT